VWLFSFFTLIPLISREPPLGVPVCDSTVQSFTYDRKTCICLFWFCFRSNPFLDDSDAVRRVCLFDAHNRFCNRLSIAICAAPRLLKVCLRVPNLGAVPKFGSGLSKIAWLTPLRLANAIFESSAMLSLIDPMQRSLKRSHFSNA
jgi:hypothetical protein